MFSGSSEGNNPIDREVEKQRRELLLRAYGSSLDEYRFNVNLGWDQTKFYVTTSSAALAAGIGLLRLALDSKLLSVFMIFYFALPAFVAFLGVKTSEVRKKYVREANLKKAIVELELGLSSDVFHEIPGSGLNIAVTPGQKDSLTAIVRRRERRDEPVRRGSVVYYTRMLFWGLVVVSVSGSILSYINLLLLCDPIPQALKR